jgi:DNA-nicking Smr family endonuclease
MKKGPKKEGTSAKSKRGILSEDDHELWEATTSLLSPLKKRKTRIHAALDRPATVEPVSKGRSGSTKVESAPLRYEPYVPPTPTKKVPALADYDAKKARRLSSGRTEIERRIDLHGMRQSEAHAALRRFLFACHAAGLRDVLVITGKGGPSRKSDHEDAHWTDPDHRGVLKRNVPLWLAEPDLRAIIVSYKSAAIRHGGEGALYIHLRRNDRV